jgi:hypothetical protein
MDRVDLTEYRTTNNAIQKLHFHHRPSSLRGCSSGELVPSLLTQQNLRAFNNETISYEKDSETASMATSADAMFPVLLRRKGIYFEYRNVCPPDDLDMVRNDLQQERINKQDNQPIQYFFQQLIYTYNEEAYKSPFNKLVFNPPSRKASDQYYAHMDIQWTRLNDKFDTKGLSKPKPDYFESLSLDQYTEEVVAMTGNIWPPYQIKLRYRWLG